jgi:hypothetical protein
VAQGDFLELDEADRLSSRCLVVDRDDDFALAEAVRPEPGVE